MFYLDTSVLVAYYFPEILSKAAEKFLLKNQSVALSDLSEVEFTSAIAKKIREGFLSKEDGFHVFSQFELHREEEMFEKISVSPEHYQLAKHWIAEFDTSLRTLDALHLAIASKEDLRLVTADRKFSESAKKLKIPTIFIQ